MAWKIKAAKAGTYTAETSGKYVDRNIEFTVPDGSASVAGKNIEKNPEITWDSASKKIKADYSGSETVGGTATAGWVESVAGATVTTSGSASVDPATLDGNLKASNIKSGATIFGVDGNLSGADFGTTEAVRTDNKVSWGTGWIEKGESIGETTERTAGDGAVSATGAGVTLGTATTVQPSGKYIKVDGSGSVSTGKGWVDNGSTSSNTATKYYPVEGATFSNEAASGKTYEDISATAPVLVSGGYLYVAEGYTGNVKISLAKLVPDSYQDKAMATSGYVRVGAFAWDEDGNPIVGAMGDASVKSGDVTVTGVTATYDAGSGLFNISVAGSASAPTVTAGGYIDGTTGTKEANASVTSTATMQKIAGNTTVSGTKTYTPSIEKQAISISGVTDAANGNATTTRPSSGVYVKVKSAANTGEITATPNVTKSGYGTIANNGMEGTTATVGANASAETYIPIATTSRAAGEGSASATATGMEIAEAASQPASGHFIKVEGSGSVSTGAGWVGSGSTSSATATKYYTVAESTHTNGCTATASAVNAAATYGTATALNNTTDYNINGVLTSAPTASGAVYMTIEPTISTTNGTAKADASASCTATAGYTAGGTATANATQNTAPVGVTTTKGDTRYIELYTGSYTLS